MSSLSIVDGAAVDFVDPRRRTRDDLLRAARLLERSRNRIDPRLETNRAWRAELDRVRRRLLELAAGLEATVAGRVAP